MEGQKFFPDFWQCRYIIRISTILKLLYFSQGEAITSNSTFVSRRVPKLLLSCCIFHSNENCRNKIVFSLIQFCDNDNKIYERLQFLKRFVLKNSYVWCRLSTWCVLNDSRCFSFKSFQKLKTLSKIHHTIFNRKNDTKNKKCLWLSLGL